MSWVKEAKNVGKEQIDASENSRISEEITLELARQAESNRLQPIRDICLKMQPAIEKAFNELSAEGYQTHGEATFVFSYEYATTLNTMEQRQGFDGEGHPAKETYVMTVDFGEVGKLTVTPKRYPDRHEVHLYCEFYFYQPYPQVPNPPLEISSQVTFQEFEATLHQLISPAITFIEKNGGSRKQKAVEKRRENGGFFKRLKDGLL